MSKAKAKAAKKADFPLWYHTPSSQWCKKVKGKVYYFGTEQDEAAVRWADEKDNIHAGRPRDWTPQSKPVDTRPTVEQLGNVFIASQRTDNETCGKPGIRHIQELEKTLHRFVLIIGKGFIAEELNSTVFQNVKRELFKPVERDAAIKGRTVLKRSPSTVAGDVRRIRVFLNWCHKNGVNGYKLPQPDYGTVFSPETETQITKESIKNAVRRNLSREDFEAIVQLAGVNFKPVLWLSLNSGIGAGDIAQIDFDDIADINSEECWVDLARLKTGVNRRFLMWPETQKAIQDYLEIRRSPIKAHSKTVFLTSHCLPWVRGEGSKDHVDTATSTFTKLRKLAGIKRGTLYDLRRTFATVATETLDFEAVRVCMGHQRNSRDMLAGYVQVVSDERIRAVCNHVRTWLFGGATK